MNLAISRFLNIKFFIAPAKARPTIIFQIFILSTKMAQLDVIKEKLQRDYDGCTVTQSYLRLERNLQSAGTTTSIKFDVLTTDSTYGTPATIENRLETTDVFVATAVSMFIYKAGSSVTASSDDRTKARLQSSPNPGTFSGSGEADNLMSLYNGNLKLLVNRKVFFDALDCYRFYRVGDVQAGLITATGGVTTQQSSQTEANYGFVGLNPTLSIGGMSQNDFTINMPSALSLIGTTSTNFLVLYFRGYQVQGAANQFEAAQRAKNFQG